MEVLLTLLHGLLESLKFLLLLPIKIKHQDIEEYWNVSNWEKSKYQW